jgi:hypothetical protein
MGKKCGVMEEKERKKKSKTNFIKTDANKYKAEATNIAIYKEGEDPWDCS